MNPIILLFNFLILAACDNAKDFSTPAQKQIDEYTNTLKKCKDTPQKEPTINNNTSSQKIPVVTEKKEYVEQNNQAQAQNLLEIQDADVVLGNPNAKVIIIEYFSYTCVHCAYYHRSIFHELKSKYIDTGKIAYVIREFIPSIKDLDAAVLARCSKNKEDFLKFTEVLLQQQEGWIPSNKYRDILVKIAKLGGIGEDRYYECLEDENLKESLISKTKKVFGIPKFVGTPSFFINGTLFTKPHSFKDLSEAIDKMM